MDDDDDEEECLDTLFHGDNPCHYGLLGKLILCLMAMAFFICSLIFCYCCCCYLSLHWSPRTFFLHACLVMSDSLWPSDPMVCHLPGSSVHGISQARILKWVPFLTLGDLPDPGIKPASPVSSALAGGFFTTVPPSFWFYQVRSRNKLDYFYAGPEWFCHRPFFYLLCLMPCKLFFLSFIGCGSEHVYSPHHPTSKAPEKPSIFELWSFFNGSQVMMELCYVTLYSSLSAKIIGNRIILEIRKIRASHGLPRPAI